MNSAEMHKIGISCTISLAVARALVLGKLELEKYEFIYPICVQKLLSAPVNAANTFLSDTKFWGKFFEDTKSNPPLNSESFLSHKHCSQYQPKFCSKYFLILVFQGKY